MHVQESRAFTEGGVVRAREAVSEFINEVAQRCKNLCFIYLEYSGELGSLVLISTITRTWVLRKRSREWGSLELVLSAIARTWVRQEGSRDEWVAQVDARAIDVSRSRIYHLDVNPLNLE